MKILYLGNFTQSHCTETHLAATLESLDHEVIRTQENGYSPAQLGNLLRNTEFDLFLFTRTWGESLTLEHLNEMKGRGIPTVSYHLDLYVGLTRKYLHGEKTLEDVLRNDPFWRTDFVFTPDGDPESQKVFKANGVNHYYMKPGVFEPECTMNQTDGYKYDVLFVGGGDKVGSPHAYGHPEWNYRNELIEWLYQMYDEEFTKFGHPQPTVRNEALNQLYADSKVVIGDSVCLAGYTHTYYWSDRVYETMGRGGFLIHPYIKGLEEEFKEDEDIVFYEYGNFEQLKEKIDYYLEHNEEREEIRRNGHRVVKANCTYTHRMKQMLDIVTSGEKLSSQSPEVSVSKINLGCGSEPTEGWCNVDILELDGVNKIHDLNIYPYPFDNHSADEIKAIDLIEHLDDPMRFVKECHRILLKDGKLFMTTPHWQSKNLWIDPTHKRGFDEKSMDYFDPDKDFGQWYGYYTDQKFTVESLRTDNDNVEFTMRKI